MAPAELLLAGSIVIGVALPTSAVLEAAKTPSDLSRYQIVNCAERPSDRCLMDIESGEFLGQK